VNVTFVSKLLPIAVAFRIALVVLMPTTPPVVTSGSTVELVSSSARRTKVGKADGTKPVIDGRLDAEHGPDAAELMPMSTTSFPTWVMTGPPESPEQIPVVAVWLAVKLPGHDGNTLNGWLIALGMIEDGLVGVVRPYPRNVTSRDSRDHVATSVVVASREIEPPGNSAPRMRNAMSSGWENSPTLRQPSTVMIALWDTVWGES
jgi:hypothetical protein